MLPITVAVGVTDPNDANLLGRLLQELRQLPARPFEILVVGCDDYLQPALRSLLESGARRVPLADERSSAAEAFNLGVAHANCGVVAGLGHTSMPLSIGWLEGVTSLFAGNTVDAAFPESTVHLGLPADPCQAVVRRSLRADYRWQEQESLCDWARRLVAIGDDRVVLDDRVACHPLVSC